MANDKAQGPFLPKQLDTHSFDRQYSWIDYGYRDVPAGRWTDGK